MIEECGLITYISNAPSAVEHQRRHSDDTAFDPVSFEEADHLEDLEGAMAAAGGDLVRGVGGRLLYMRLWR